MKVELVCTASIAKPDPTCPAWLWVGPFDPTGAIYGPVEQRIEIAPPDLSTYSVEAMFGHSLLWTAGGDESKFATAVVSNLRLEYTYGSTVVVYEPSSVTINSSGSQGTATLDGTTGVTFIVTHTSGLSYPPDVTFHWSAAPLNSAARYHGF